MAKAQAQHDAWIKAVFGVDPAVYLRKAEHDIAAGLTDEAQARGEYAAGEQIVHQGYQARLKATQKDTSNEVRMMDMAKANKIIAQGEDKERQAKDHFNRGLAEELKGRQELERVDVLNESYVASQHGGQRINEVIIMFSDYLDNRLTGGNVRVRIEAAGGPRELPAGQKIPDIEFHVSIDKSTGEARYSQGLVVWPEGQVSLEVWPPEWMRKVMGNGVLNAAATPYHLKPGATFLRFRAKQGNREVKFNSGSTAGQSHDIKSSKSHQTGSSDAAEVSASSTKGGKMDIPEIAEVNASTTIGGKYTHNSSVLDTFSEDDVRGKTSSTHGDVTQDVPKALFNLIVTYEP